MNKSSLHFISFYSQLTSCFMCLVSNCSLIRSGESRRCFDTHEREAAVLFSWCGLNNNRQVLVQLCSWHSLPGSSTSVSHTFHLNASPASPFNGRISKSSCAVHALCTAVLLAWKITFKKKRRCFYWETLTITWWIKGKLRPKIKNFCLLIFMLLQEFSKNVHAFLFHT